MDPLTAVLALGFGLVLGYIGMRTLASSIHYGFEVRAALASVTDVGEASSGFVKVCGTVREADATFAPAVAETPTVVSVMTRSIRKGGAKVLGGWDEVNRSVRMVPFYVETDSGSMLVKHTGEFEDEVVEGISSTETTEFDASEHVPESIAGVFTERPDQSDVGPTVETLADDGEEGTLGANLAERGEEDGSETEGQSNAVGDGGTLLPQKFEEQYVSPGDKVYVIGRADADADELTLTDDGMVFRILTEPRNGAVVGNLGWTIFFAGITTVVAVTLYNLATDLLAEVLALL